MGNELKLFLENFQSIASGELTFKTGTNVIIGQSNSGKTATFRALKACLLNPSGSQRFIKKRTNEAKVTLEYNGNRILWKKSKDENSYNINGEDYLKTGRSDAFKLVDNTGFVLDCDDTIMNIEEELQLPFPFGLSKNDLFKLFENVFCVSDSAVIMKAAKVSESSIKSDIENLEVDITKNKNKLKALKEFKEDVDLSKLKKFKEMLEGAHSKISSLADGLPSIKKASKVAKITLPEVDFQNLLIDYKSLRGLKKEALKIKALHKVVKGLNSSGVPESHLNKYNELKDLHEMCSVLKSLNELQIPENVFGDVSEDYRELKDLHEMCSVIKKLGAIKMPDETFENKIQAYKELESFKKALLDLKQDIKERMQRLKEKQEEVTELEARIKKVKVCPLCHHEL